VPVSGFVNRHPTVKMVALSFFLLIGMTLVTTGAGFHVPTGHNDAAMGFSVIVAPTLSEISDPDKKLKGWTLRQPGSHYRLVATAA
jgi:predicted tellurium resistance membrane protein TerC